MDFYNSLLAQKLSGGGGGGGDKYAAFKALVDDSLTEVTAEMLDGVTTINSYAFFQSANLTNVEVPDSVTIIGESAFNHCTSLSSIIIPNSVTTISDSAFVNCTSLSSIIIPNSVTTIGINAFAYDTNLLNIIIPNSVTKMGRNAFYGCSRLTIATVQATNPPTIGTSVFGGTHANLVIYVPSESVDAYKSASNWSTYADRIQAIPSD